MIASLFGLMNLFARALGGIFSDYAYNRIGIRGRLLVLFLTLVGEGIILLIFCYMTNLYAAIALLIGFSVFVQASEGAVYAVVPVVNPRNIGAVAGIVGAGGNIGAVLWQTMFRSLTDQSFSYMILAVVIIIFSLLVLVMPVDNTFLLFGQRKKKTALSNGPSETNGQNFAMGGVRNPAYVP